MLIKFITLFTLVTLLLLIETSCTKPEETRPLVEPRSSHGSKKVTTITTPDSVSGKWESVSIGVLNKSTASQKIYIVPVGGSYTVPSTNMTIEVEAFLPSFIMQGTNITSSSNKLTNPAAKVRISENNTTIFQGWLFSLHQNTHVLVHPVYGFNLIEAHPVNKKSNKYK